MAASNEQLMIQIGAKLDRLEGAMRRAGQMTEATARQMEDRFDSVNPSFAGMRTGIAGVTGLLAGISVAPLIAGIKAANDEFIKLGDTARLTGLAVERLAGLQSLGRANGISTDQTSTDFRKLAELLNQGRREENELTKLLDANNIKWKDRQGNVIDVNTAVEHLSRLIANAGFELDRIDIGKKAGLSEGWVRILSRGPTAFRQMREEAELAARGIDQELVNKAREFDRVWKEGWEKFALYARAAIGDVIKWVGTLLAAQRQIGQAGGFDGNGLPTERAAEPSSAAEAVRRQNRVAVDLLARRLRDRSPVDFSDFFNENGRRNFGVPTINVRNRGGSGSSGSETTDADRAQARLERYIETLMRQEAVEKAIAATIGQSKAAQQAAVEVARAQVDLAKLDEATRQRITEQLTAQVRKLEEQRQATERLKQVQQSYNELLTFAGNTAIDALDRMIVGGQSFGQVVGDITRQLARMILQASLLGTGPLAALFGLQGSNGGIGGLFGALFGSFGGARAAGGPVSAGRSYLVGEKGPELFVPSSGGMIVPNGLTRGGGAGVAVSFGDTMIDARGSSMSEAQFRSILADHQQQTLRLVPAAVQKARSTRDLDTRR